MNLHKVKGKLRILESEELPIMQLLFDLIDEVLKYEEGYKPDDLYKVQVIKELKDTYRKIIEENTPKSKQQKLF